MKSIVLKDISYVSNKTERKNTSENDGNLSKYACKMRKIYVACVREGRSYNHLERFIRCGIV